MANEIEGPRPLALWKGMSEEQRAAAARAFWEDEQSAAEQAEVITLIARQINFRAKSVLTMPVDRRIRYVARMTRMSDPVAARLLVSYHLGTQRPMMAAFLDQLGIAHDNGLISEENVKAPEADKLEAAARHVQASFPAPDVKLYFSTLVLQDPDTWGGLRPFLETPVADLPTT